MARSKRRSDDVAPEDEEFVEYDPDAEDEDAEDESDDTTDADEDADDTDDEDADDEDADDAPAGPAKGRSGVRDATRRSSRRSRSRTRKSAGRGSGRTSRRGGTRSPLGGSVDGPPRRRRTSSKEAAGVGAALAGAAPIWVIGLCILVAVAILAWPVYMFVTDSMLRATPRNEIGVPAAQAGCLPEESNPATGNQEHVPDGTRVPYPRLPPDSGPHYNVWAPFGTTFYDMSDRPEIENLVHNLEHGYTILWYNADTVSDEEKKELEVLAGTFNGTDPSTNKFIAAPWSPTTDGGAFPEGTDFLLTRWTADPQNPTDVSKQFGVRQGCVELSGEAVVQFMERHPQPNSPEPQGG